MLQLSEKMSRLGTETAFERPESLSLVYRDERGRRSELTLPRRPVPIAMPFALLGWRFVVAVRARSEEAVYWLWAVVSFGPKNSSTSAVGTISGAATSCVSPWWTSVPDPAERTFFIQSASRP